MRSKDVTLAIPHKLWEAFEKHAPEVGYKNARQFLIWCGLYSLLVQKPHSLTAPIAACPLDIQDEIIETVCDAYMRGEIKRGSFFESFMEDVVTRLGVTASPDVVRAVIADALRHRRKKDPQS